MPEVRVDGGGAPDVGVGGAHALVVRIVAVRGRAMRLVARTLLPRGFLRAQLVRDFRTGSDFALNFSLAWDCPRDQEGLNPELRRV